MGKSQEVCPRCSYSRVDEGRMSVRSTLTALRLFSPSTHQKSTEKRYLSPDICVASEVVIAARNVVQTSPDRL
jgi:hypothetical protein